MWLKYKEHLTHSNLSKDVSLIKTPRPACIVNLPYYPKSRFSLGQLNPRLPKRPPCSFFHLSSSFLSALFRQFWPLCQETADDFSQQVQRKHCVFLQPLYKHPRQAAFIDQAQSCATLQLWPYHQPHLSPEPSGGMIFGNTEMGFGWGNTCVEILLVLCNCHSYKYNKHSDTHSTLRDGQVSMYHP